MAEAEKMLGPILDAIVEEVVHSDIVLSANGALTGGNHIGVAVELDGAQLAYERGDFEYLLESGYEMRISDWAGPFDSSVSDTLVLPNTDSPSRHYGEVDNLCFFVGSAEEKNYHQSITTRNIDGEYTQSADLLLTAHRTYFYQIDECGELCQVSTPENAYTIDFSFHAAFFLGVRTDVSIGLKRKID